MYIFVCLPLYVNSVNRWWSFTQSWRAKCQINELVKGSTGEWRMCHTSPLRARARQGPERCVGLIKLDCLAVIRARCGQALAMVVRPHLLCRGVGGEEGVVGEGPQLVDLWPRAGTNHEPMLTAAMDAAGDLLSSLSLSDGLRALSRCVLYNSFKALYSVSFICSVFQSSCSSLAVWLLFTFIQIHFLQLHPFVLRDKKKWRLVTGCING